MAGITANEKSGNTVLNNSYAALVAPKIQFSNQFITDLKVLANLRI
jgi:hypothetical protein